MSDETQGHFVVMIVDNGYPAAVTHTEEEAKAWLEEKRKAYDHRGRGFAVLNEVHPRLYELTEYKEDMERAPWTTSYRIRFVTNE